MDTEKNTTDLKKKKIAKIFKVIAKILIIITGVILIWTNCKKAHAEEPSLNYGNYNMIVEINTSDYDNESGLYTGYMTVIATIDVANINYIYIDSTLAPDYTADEANLLAGPVETYGASEITLDNIYFVRTQEQYTEEATNYNIIAASEINTYYQYYVAETRSNAYASALSDNKEEIFKEGEAKGIRDTLDKANYDKAQAALTYITQIKDLQTQLANAQATINSGGNWANLKNLLTLIFLFPIRFFKEGMDVNLFGVNIGGFILGVFLIGITLAIIGFILGRRKA